MMWFFQGLERMRLMVTCDLIAKIAALVATFAFVRGPQDDWKVLGLQGAAATLSLPISLVLAWREVGMRVPTLKLVRDALQRSLPSFIPRNASVFFTHESEPA